MAQHLSAERAFRSSRSRDLMPLLGYGSTSWHNFEKVIKEAMIAASEAAAPLDDHFNAVVEE
jgi:hypothetical protein